MGQLDSSTEFSVEVWLGDAIVQKSINTDFFSARVIFENNMKAIASRKAPMKIRMSYLYYKKYEVTNEDFIEFTNTLWDSAHKKGEQND